ncbi:MAG TPA: patatin-like phospholipase family protein, partial [Vicinamibacteria bacterium]|nr:patatin-like phospholipase family protein [Vicinamibacteria bacterium]
GAPKVDLRGDRVAVTLPVRLARGEGRATLRFRWAAPPRPRRNRLGGRVREGMPSRILALAALVGAGAAARAQPPPEVVPPPRPRLALALSGGGARGIAHVGALRALEEGGIPVDAIAANSMGAIVGGIYATGKDAAQLEAIVRSMDWASLFSGRPDRRTLPVARREDRYGSTAGVSFDWRDVKLPGGLLAEHRVNRFLIEHLSPAGYAAGGDFDRLPIPFRAIAADLADGEPVVMAKGDLARAVRASMSIPLLFPPVEWEGRRLVDGLVVDNLPIDVAKAFEPRVLVAVDTSSPPLEPSEYESAFGVATQVSDLLTRRRYRDFEAAADVLVRPDLGKHSSTDYSGFDDLIAKGYEATRASLPAIREKLASAGVDALEPRRGAPAARPLEGAPIRAVRVEGNERVSEGLTRRAFNIPIGPGYLMERGLRAFDKVDATGLFDRTWMAFEPAGDGVAIVLRVKDAPPNRAEVGLGYSEWEKARGSIRVRNQNTLGFGEQVELLLAGSDAESLLWASLRGDRLFLPGLGYRVRGGWTTDKPRFFDAEGEEINRGRFERQEIEASLAVSLERWGLVEAGARFGRVRTEPEAGLDLPESLDQVGALSGTIVLDTLDDLAWPEHGRRLAVRGQWNLDGLGAERPFWRLEIEGRTGRQLGRRLVAQVDGRVGLSGDDLPVYDWYRLGGVELLPGYRHEELKGAQALAGAVSLRCRVKGQLRLVARAGAGNVFARAGDVTLDGLRWGVGVGLYHPSPIGPVSVELGVRDGGSTLATLAVGWN